MVSAGGFAVGAIAAGAAILRFEADNALQNGPSYIKEGVPTSAPGQIGQAIARQACRRYADGVDSLLDERAVDFETVCRPYLDNIGYGGRPKFGKPFDGGQCEVRYDVFGTYVSNQDNVGGCGTSRDWQVLSIPGPVGGIVVSGPVQGGWQVQGNGFRFNCVDVLNNSQLLDVPECGPSVGPGTVRAQRPVIVSVARVDGLPDDCGNLPPEYTEPNPPTEPGPPTEPFNPGPEINIDVGVTINVDGSINVDVGTGPIVINPFGGGGGDDGGGPDEPSPPAPEPGPENPGGNGGLGGDDEFGPPPAGRRWVGCCIRITNRPDNSGIIVGSEPEDVYPSVIGNVRLVFNAAGNRQTDTPIRILAKHVCVWEPVAKLNPTGVNVDLLPGFGYVFTPYSVPLED